MSVWDRSARALLLGVSSLALCASGVLSGANAQSAMTLDPVTVLATKTSEKTTEALAAVSSVRQEQIDQFMPNRVSEIFQGMPGVWMSERGDDPATAINIRGLQDFGRVNVLIDGARQNFQRSGHNANGMFYLEPEILSGVDVVRGPVANIYGSGAIGGVVSFQTKDVDDVLKPGQRFGALMHGQMGSFGAGLGSTFLAARTPYADLFGGYVGRKNDNYSTGEIGSPIANMPADGVTVRNTYNDTRTGIGKATFRPAQGHEVKISGIAYDSYYRAPWTASTTASVYDTHVMNNTITGSYKYSRPEDRIFDYAVTAYWNESNTDQKNVQPASAIGRYRNFNIDTKGFDANNTSRFDTGPVRHALTYGGDFFKDDVLVTDPYSTAALFTPSGERTVSGGFAQLRSNYSTWLEVITGVRYDQYNLSGGGSSSSGSRVSPKATVGITPIRWFTVYGTYAEGYRAPAVTETLVTGTHPPSGLPIFTCADGTIGLFCFLPNPNLRPEVGKNKEVGVNIREDNLFAPGDKLRIKANWFRNDVSDFIEGVNYGPSVFVPGFGTLYKFFQYQNIANAKLQGYEWEGTYDAGVWFIGVSGHRIRGNNVDTNAPLRTVPPDMIATTVGARFFDRKLTALVRWQSVAGKDANSVPAGTTPVSSYELVGLYFGWQFRPNAVASFSVDNLLDNYYIRYLDGIPSAGRTFKAGLKVQFSDETFKGG